VAGAEAGFTSEAGRAGIAGTGGGTGATAAGEGEGGTGAEAWAGATFGFVATGAVERMAGVSEGAGLSGRDVGFATGDATGTPDASSWNFARICSTVDESRPAKILDFTSKPQL